MLSVVATKAIALTVMALITLTFSMLPLMLRNLLKGCLKSHKAQVAVSSCLCFGGGVLLATVFLHLIPEARLLTDQAFEKGFLPKTNYPVAELIVCGGFFLIYIIEDIVHACNDYSNKPTKNQTNAKTSHPDIPSLESEPLKPISKNTNVGENDQGKAQENISVELESEDDRNKSTSTVKAVIFVAAFSFHSIMEGLALGLVKSNNNVWFLFAALLAHKVVIAFCMAMELLEVQIHIIGFLSSMIIFSIASPLGGLLGTLIVSFASNNSQAGFLTTTVLQGISAGTILYVTFCEVLERERQKSEGKTLRLVSIMVGFCVMAVLQIFDDESLLEEEHHHHVTMDTYLQSTEAYLFT